ncbi:MAG: bifunctional UDP-N-acetylglucosamine diphosphorylase/glucosamine-1-phosphate N-acetyltransferase GlmU [Mycobacteriales bacterium]
MTPDHRPAAVIVLAAGEGTRMRSATPKVAHPMCGRTLLGHVLAAAAPLGAARTLVVLGAGREQVGPTLPDGVATVVQEEPRGTGHAVRVALDAAALSGEATVLVLPGDSPLLTAETLGRLVAEHLRTRAAATLLTAVLPRPTGYGRVLRGPAGEVRAVVEERDADPATREVGEVATSVYAFAAGPLADCLAAVGRANAAGEEYLTDVVALLYDRGLGVASVVAPDPTEALGVNDQLQLAEARRAMRDRLVRAVMLGGATVVDPQTTWLGVAVRVEADAVIYQNTQLHGATVIESGAEVGPNVTLRDTVVRAGARVQDATATGADIGPGAQVGPYAYLRPGTVLGRGAKAGSYVEIKASTVGEGSKVPHLSYVGDATIGARTNIGAATVFVNFDGRDKHRTEVGDDVRVGSDTMLVAPVKIGDGAYTAAGSVITTDVPAGALGVGRARQRNVEGWVARRHRAPVPNGATATEAAEGEGDRAE